MGQIDDGIRQKPAASQQSGTAQDPHASGLRTTEMGNAANLVGPLTEKQEALKGALEKLGIKINNMEDPKELRGALRALSETKIIPEEKKANILLALHPDRFVNELETENRIYKIPSYFEQLKGLELKGDSGWWKSPLAGMAAFYTIPIILNPSNLSNPGFMFGNAIAAFFIGGIGGGLIKDWFDGRKFAKLKSKALDLIQNIPEGREVIDIIKTNMDKLGGVGSTYSERKVVQVLVDKQTDKLVGLYQLRDDLGAEYDAAQRRLIRA